MEKKKPEIRFNGFEGEWASYAFRFLFTEKRDTTQDEFEDQLLSCAIDGIYLNSELFNHFRGSTTIGYLKVKRYDLILSAQNLHLGNANVNLRFASGIISPAYKVYTINGDDPYFINAWVKSEHAKNFFMSATTEGASLCRKNIEWEFLYDKKICIPSLSEQEKIGLFLTTLDKLIAKLEAKLDKLRKLKQALLEKMFANVNVGGGKTPEIRFKGFEGEWATTTLGECFLERIERSAEGELISVTISQGVVRASDLDRIDNSSNDKSNYKVVEVGDIAYNSMRMWQGACGYSLYKGICSPAYTVVIPQNNIDVVYCFYLFKRNETLQLFRVNSQGLTSDTWNLKYPAFSQIKCSYPPLSEQRQIGKYFTQIDTHFSKTSTKLTKLRNIKQSLLQKMFA